MKLENAAKDVAQDVFVSILIQFLYIAGIVSALENFVYLVRAQVRSTACACSWTTKGCLC